MPGQISSGPTLLSKLIQRNSPEHGNELCSRNGAELPVPSDIVCFHAWGVKEILNCEQATLGGEDFLL